MTLINTYNNTFPGNIDLLLDLSCADLLLLGRSEGNRTRVLLRDGGRVLQEEEKSGLLA